MKLIANSANITPNDTFSYFYGESKIKYNDFMELTLKSDTKGLNLDSASINEYGAYVLTKKIMNQGTLLAQTCPDLGLSSDPRHVYDVKEYQAIEEKIIVKRLQDSYKHKISKKRKK